MDEFEDIDQTGGLFFDPTPQDDDFLPETTEDGLTFSTNYPYIDYLSLIMSEIGGSLIRGCIDRLEVLRLSENRIIKDSINNVTQEESLTKHHRFQQEIIYIVNILNNLCEELSSSASFTTLINFIETQIKLEDEKNQLKSEYEMNQQYFVRLKKEILSQKTVSNENKLNMNQFLIETRKQLEKQRVYFSMALNYATKWETARHEQHVSILEEKQSQFELQIRTMKTRYDQELLCHNDILLFIQESKTDCLNNIQNWMDKYDNDTEQKDMEIYNMKVEIDNAKETHTDLINLYEQRCKEMFDWRLFKLQRIIRNRAAIKIQAWWRQVMIVKHLGPYRKKKKKGKKKKGDKKGAKKGAKKVGKKKAKK